jgi:hypothetical protein
MLVNLAQVTQIQVEPPVNDQAQVTFTFSNGQQQTVSLAPPVIQRLYSAIPRPTIYGAGGMG